MMSPTYTNKFYSTSEQFILSHYTTNLIEYPIEARKMSTRETTQCRDEISLKIKISKYEHIIIRFNLRKSALDLAAKIEQDRQCKMDGYSFSLGGSLLALGKPLLIFGVTEDSVIELLYLASSS